MSLIIKSLKDSGEFSTYAGQQVEGGNSFPIPDSELSAFRSSEALEIDILSGVTAVISDLSPEFELVGSDGLKLLLGNESQPITLNPFQSKTIEGKSLYRRKHGLIKSCPQGETFFDFIVPYDNVKINELEVTNGQIGDEVDLFVHDTEDGLIQQSLGVPAGSITPFLILNQFGFGVSLPNGFYRDQSQYDADLIKNMKVSVVYKNNGILIDKNGVNIVFHEIK